MEILAKNIWEEHLNIYSPFIENSKTDIVKIGRSLKVPYQNTWSCYSGLARPCLKCGTCQERSIAFRDSGNIDPLLTDIEWKQALVIVKGIK